MRENVVCFTGSNSVIRNVFLCASFFIGAVFKLGVTVPLISNWNSIVKIEYQRRIRLP